MKRVKFIMVGGFLGAGKTTTLARLARHYAAQGLRVGLVTNDQAEDLVDTLNLRARGLPVVEVAGACFCCRFDDLIARVEQLQQSEHPDVILAEPVGSCTDLIATVVQPLKDLYGHHFQVAPYPVLFKPSHGVPILQGWPSGFSEKAAYIFRKQLEEADAVVLNRLDELTPPAAEYLTTLLAHQFPGMPVLRLSARTGQGFEALTAFLEQDGPFGRRILDIDYDVYAAGEAELGWLNASLRVCAGQPFLLDELLLDVARRLREEFGRAGSEAAHLKILGQSGPVLAVVNLVSNALAPELSLASGSRLTDAELTINARVILDPANLEKQVQRAIAGTVLAAGGRTEMIRCYSLRPGRPIPTHRYVAAV